MFAEQRRNMILQILKERTQVEVLELTEMLNVSEATVRRDLEKLEQNRLLKRTHGGAMLIEQDISSPRREITQQASQQDIDLAKTAVKLIDDDNTIVLGSGPVCLALALEIRRSQIPCTIITNNIFAIETLLGSPQISLVMLGGMVEQCPEATALTTGDFALHMLNSFFVDQAFLSVDGISMKAGLTLNDPSEALIWQKMRSIAEKTIILARPSSFEEKGLVRLIPLNKIDAIVSTAAANEEFRSYYYNQNIPFYIGFGE